MAHATVEGIVRITMQAREVGYYYGVRGFCGHGLCFWMVFWVHWVQLVCVCVISGYVVH